MRVANKIVGSGALVLFAAAASCGPAQPWGRREGQALILHVPADQATIQAAIDAAQDGDTVEVAPGDYVENLTVPAGVRLIGAAPDTTTLRGNIYLNGANARVAGLRITAVGAAIDPGATGVRGFAQNVELSNLWIESFSIAIELDGSDSGKIDGNIIRRNGGGIVSLDASALTITNNLVLNNRANGITISGGQSTAIAHNTFVGNGFGLTVEEGGAAVVAITAGQATVENNIMVSNNGGIRGVGAPAATLDHNLVWGNAANYSGNAVAGAGDRSVDPLFANASQGDFRLKAGSPAIDAGLAGLAADDFDGIVRPQGAAPDLGAHEFRLPPLELKLVISEVMANPVDEDRGEFLEIYNAGKTAVDLAGKWISDRDAFDTLVALQGGATTVAAGAYAVVIDPEYVSGYGIPQGTTVVTVANSTLGNGLSTSDALTLYDNDRATVLSTYAHPFDPGNGVSAEMVDLAGRDLDTNWRRSPCTQSAGRPNCAPVTLASGVILTEIMSNPTDETTGEFIELYNGTDAPIDVNGWTIDDGDGVDTIRARAGGPTVIPAQTYAVVLDPDFPADQIAIQIDPNAVLLTVENNAIGNGLAVTDPITLRSGVNVVDTYTRALRTSDGKSVEKVSLSLGDAAGNWAQSSCTTGSSPGRLNCVSSASAGPRKPLVITEVMANPLDEDTGEFVEIYNRGIDAVDAAGLIFSDGDAVDVLVAYQGGTTVIPAGGYALILDNEYAGQYTDVPSGAVKLTTPDGTIGSGLGLDDALRLLESNGVEIIDTFRYPFNPGNGWSAERIDVRAFDTAANWTASTCVGKSSPGKNNCAATPAGLPKQVRITEVMANQAGTDTSPLAGEFVELFNFGERSVDLAGMYLESGTEASPSRDRLLAWQAGPTVLAPGAFAVVLDPQYDNRYTTTPAGTVLVTLDDASFGSGGLATTHWVTLYDADGITLLDRFRYPSDPGDGISLYRVSVTATDSAANWAATPCNATPGAASCPGGGTEVNTYTSFWLDNDASEGGHYWYQAIGWPENGGNCELVLVCTGGSYGYDFRDNFPAPAAFTFRNPYTGYSVTFEERSSATDNCSDDPDNLCAPRVKFGVGPGEEKQVPASSLGFYFATTSGPRLNSLDWFNGDPDRYWALPPDGTLAPFTVEVP